MRYVDIQQVHLPEEIAQKLKEATDALKLLPNDAERSDYIKKHAELWSAVKPYLASITGKHEEDYKCWYCEVKDIRFPYQIDHYRPKNRVKNKKSKAEPGYWWLAFKLSNYRLSCSLCNSPKSRGKNTYGKWDQFPLEAGSVRASKPNDNIDDEICLILDPTRPEDPELLDFADDGRVYPHYSEGLFVYRKAYESIGIFNLNDVRIEEARKQTRLKCIEKVEEGDRAFSHWKQNGSPAAYGKFRQICKDILDMVSISAEFSAAARYYFIGTGKEWLIRILMHC